MSESDNKQTDDKLATNSPEGETPKDAAGVTGGEYADPDPNPAFHGEEGTPATEPAVADAEPHTAYEEATPGQPGHVAP